MVGPETAGVVTRRVIEHEPTRTILRERTRFQRGPSAFTPFPRFSCSRNAQRGKRAGTRAQGQDQHVTGNAYVTPVLRNECARTAVRLHAPPFVVARERQQTAVRTPMFVDHAAPKIRHVFHRHVRNVYNPTASATVEVGAEVSLELAVTIYGHDTTAEAYKSIIFLAGEDIAEVKDGKLTVKGEGRSPTS